MEAFGPHAPRSLLLVAVCYDEVPMRGRFVSIGVLVVAGTGGAWLPQPARGIMGSVPVDLTIRSPEFVTMM